MNHGTLSGYLHGKCRCDPCTEANRQQGQKGRRRKAAGERQELRAGHGFTAQQRVERRNCLICHTSLTDHPLRACWREL